MPASSVRNWLGIYFLLVTGILGSYLLLFRETKLLPISKQEAIDSFEIIIPVFIGQLNLIFKWFSGNDPSAPDEAPIPVPKWVVIGPPVMVVSILAFSIVALIVSNSGDQAWIDPSSFKGVVTLCVSILNATTIYVVIRYFETKKPADAGAVQNPSKQPRRRRKKANPSSSQNP